MEFKWLKHVMPRGLYGRAALILVLPVIVMQLVILVVFIQRHFEDVTRQMTNTVLLELQHIVDLVERAPDSDAALMATAEVSGALRYQLDLPSAPRSGFERVFYDVSGRTVAATLREELSGLQAIDLATSLRRVAIQVDTRHGPMMLKFDRRKVSASNPHQLLVLMVFTGVVMTAVAFLYMRNQLRPITRLARAAEAFGKGRAGPYKPSGATEVRAAGAAFLDMRRRIERQTAQRTLMLSGVSHDLRTPLTRLKLGLSMVEPSQDIAEMERDVADMEDLIDAFLDFARVETLDDLEQIAPFSLARAAVEAGRRGGGSVTLHPLQGEAVNVSLRPRAVKRALANLIGNALRYAGRAEVSVHVTDKSVYFRVEDDGPGIPPERREEATRPFARLDAARNQDKGTGVGLGLSIAADIARGHGGALQLGESATFGGLQADLVLAR
ncbi:ATP-binding protein [Actibacterium sp. 188UL27-1]|uniref:ATP-binding protein n=1 Tax=Actibacterium sp. 188UL27-1 TaxID=2786961 RepID=UPI0019587B0E|nr:ATP-binding protein [Actibacterium sp. 188UL27-1]MBM7067337.1 HAMP domain-containing protein [Actibacterium sp. 188UL27-1]